MLFITCELRQFLTDGENNTQIDLLSDDVTVMTSSSRKVVCMFRIKFPTKHIFRIFPILRTNGMAPFGNYLWNDPRRLLNKRVSLYDIHKPSHDKVCRLL